MRHRHFGRVATLRRLQEVASLGIAVLLTTACGGSTPSASNAPAAIPPTPTPTDPCTALGAGDQMAMCQQSPLQLGTAVDTAIDGLITQQPTVFDLNQAEGSVGSRDYLVVDVPAYFDGVVGNLKSAGVCAEADLFNQHRIKVKKTSALSEDYNILSVDTGGGSFIQRSSDPYPSSSYSASCTPAAFPLDPNADTPPPDQDCFYPYPPIISKMGMAVELKYTDHWTLDSTPLVTDNAGYCSTIGYTDGRSTCPLRLEGNRQRVPCEDWRIGTALDTGRLGPTWTRDGKYCTGLDSGCQNSPDNPFELWIYGDNSVHTFVACPAKGGCGSLDVDY